MSDPLARLNAALKDRYLVEREIGEGGMARVYLARDLRHDRDLALKVLRPELASVIGSERFLTEIRTTAKLQHPNILPLIDSGEADGILYFLVPYVSGESLKERIAREGQLSVDEALRIAMDVAGALDFAHRQGVVHRDVKPGNILLSDGRPLVADFGIALELSGDEAERLTRSGFSVGTAGYMSPEQAVGERQIDPRSDIYSLGCTLYEMLTGEPPFTGPSPRAVLAKQLRTAVPSVRVLRESVDPAVDEVIRRALSMSSADRFESAGAFAAALEAAKEGRYHELQGGRRRLGPAVVGALVLTSIAVIGTWIVTRPAPSLPDLNDEKVVIFQLSDETGGNGPGADVSVWVHSALAHARPIRAIDGWAWLSPSQRGDIALLTHDEARAIARDQGARFYLQGHVVGDGDSTRVSLQLFDTRGDSLYASGSAVGRTDELSSVRIAHAAFLDLMPGWLDPERRNAIDITPLTDRLPAAVALWIAGEREYRQSRFGAAADRYQSAIETDSLMVVAAVKGALAARWLDRADSAQSLVALAMRNPSLLPVLYRGLAQALDHYLAGRATQASQVLQQVLDEDPDWAEAWMALGETHYHLFPEDVAVDSSAEAAFAQARSLDPTYSPPLYHLTEIYARRGELERADSLRRLFAGVNPDSHRRRVLDLVMICARRGPADTPWGRAAEEAPLAALDAAQSLSAGGARLDCAEAGFRAVYALDSPTHDWGSLTGLASVLLARRRYDETRSLLDQAAEGHIGLSARLLQVVGVLAGAPMNDRAEELDALARSVFGTTYQGPQAPTLWLLGAWHASQGRPERVRVLAQALTDAPGDTTVNNGYRAALTAHLAAMEGDTATAIRALSALRPMAKPSELSWGYAEPLPYEQVTLARLWHDIGENERAVRAAQLVDHQQPIIYVAFLPASLQVRIDAAGSDESRRQYTRRLDQLLDTETAAAPSSP